MNSGLEPVESSRVAHSAVKKQYDCKPSLATYETAIWAIGYSLDESAPQLAQDVLKRLYRLHETGVVASNLKPQTNTYNAVLNALSRCRRDRWRHAKMAEEILQDMAQRAKNGETDVRPDVRSWAAVLRAWSNCDHIKAAEQAQRVLEELEMLYERGESTVRPNYVCYTQVCLVRMWCCLNLDNSTSSSL